MDLGNLETIKSTAISLLKVAEAYPSVGWRDLKMHEQDELRALLNACHVLLSDYDNYEVEKNPFARRTLFFNE